MKLPTMFLPLLIISSAVPVILGVTKGQTPLCDRCKCFNETSPSPDVICSKQVYTNFEFVFDESNYVDDENNLYPIRMLDLSDTSFHQFLKVFPKTKVEILDLTHNFIESITEELFKNMESLFEIKLSFNDIHDIAPGVFKGYQVDGMDYPLKTLRILRLDNNRIHSLHTDTFEHIDRELEELYLDYNPLKIIDLTTQTAINSLLQIKVLSLSYTGIASIPDTFLHTPAYLVTLDLSGNQFNAIPKGLSDSHVLDTLFFNNNPIDELTEENGFPLVTTIRTLHLCNMPNLTKIGKHSLASLTNLTKLHISNNIALTEIDPAALIRYDVETLLWPKIQELYLQNNKLTTIDMQLLWKWSDLSQLDIRQNAWTCECENQWLLDELMPVMVKLDPERAKGVLCAAPIEMQGKSMMNLSTKHSEMRCLDMFGNRPEKDAKILVGVLIGVLIGVPLVLFLIFAYQRQWFGLFDKSPAAFSRQFYGRTTTEDNMGF